MEDWKKQCRRGPICGLYPYEISRVLHSIIQKTGKSLADIGKELDLTRQAMSSINAGKSATTKPVLLALDRLYGLEDFDASWEIIKSENEKIRAKMRRA